MRLWFHAADVRAPNQIACTAVPFVSRKGDT